MSLLAHAAGLAGTGLFVTAVWRRRDEPTALPLLGMALVSFAGVLAVASVLLLDPAEAAVGWFTQLGSDSWLLLAFVYPVLGLGLWVPFGFQYTGRGDRVAAGVIVLVGVLVAAMVLPLFADRLFSVGPGVELANFASFVALSLMAALSAVALFVVVDESLRLGGSQAGEAALLVGGVAALVFAPAVATVTDNPGLFSGLAGASGLCFAIAVSRFGLFETLPVARVVARDRVIDDIEEAVIVVDRHGSVRDINPAGESVFAVDRAAALERSLETLFPDSLDLESLADRTVERRGPGGRRLVVSADRVTDNRDRLFGYLLVCRDVTERRDRERRLGVLNELLVGALGEQMAEVADTSEALVDRDREVEPAAEEIWSTATELVELVARARDIERALGDHTGAPTDAASIARSVAETHDVSVTTPDGPVSCGLSPALLEAILETLFEELETAASAQLAVRSDRLVLTAESLALDPDRPAVELVDIALEHVGGGLSMTDDDGDSRLVLLVPTDGAQREVARS